MKPIEALKSARNTYICHQVNRVRLSDFEENRFVRRHITFHGRVQRVGFRIELAQMAERLELTGWVENEDDGSVTLEVQGDPALFLRLFALIQRSDYIQITSLHQRDLAPDPWERDFRVRGCW